MNITLPPDLEQFVQERIAAGRSGTADDVVRDALLLLKEYEIDRQQRLEALRADIAEGIASLERGERISGEELFARLRSRLAAAETV